jgi:hypothetical protein
MSTVDVDPWADPATAQLLADQRRERQMHDAVRLLAAAQAVAARLPHGPVCLLSRNAEGTAICAAAAALRTTTGALCWDQVALHRAYTPPAGHAVFFVDTVDLTGSWLAEQLGRQLPDAKLVDGLWQAASSADVRAA